MSKGIVLSLFYQINIHYKDTKAITTRLKIQIAPENLRPDPNDVFHDMYKDTLTPADFPAIDRDQEVTIKVSTETNFILSLYVTYLK